MARVVLVHLSDIHFTAREDGLAERNESLRHDIINDLGVMRGKVGDATALVVTGDIAFSAAPAEYVQAQTWLEEVAGVIGSDRAQILTVPGNHDVDRGQVGRSALLAHERLRTCNNDELDAELQNFLDDPGRPLLGPLDNYNLFAAPYGCEVPPSGKAWESPIDLGDGYTLAVRGLCSVFTSDARDDRQTLLLGKTQTTLRAEPGKVYFLLAHHGPDDCRDESSIRDRIKDRAAVLLTGHRHDQRVRTVDGRIELTAGAVNPEDRTGWHPSYNWLAIEVEHAGASAEVVLEVWHRVWRPEWNAFGSGFNATESEAHRIAIGMLAVSASAPGKQAPPATAPVKNGAAAGPAAVPPGNVDGGAVSAPQTQPEDPMAAEEADGSAEPRPGLADEHGEVGQERRLRRSLHDLAPPAQFGVLTECGLLEPDDWTKEYLTMLSDAIALARRRGELDRLDQAVRAATEATR